jgi:hypothetical protein
MFYRVAYLIAEYQVEFEDFKTLNEVFDFAKEVTKEDPYAILEIKCHDDIDRRKPNRN